jgi:hypothetical protein
MRFGDKKHDPEQVQVKKKFEFLIRESISKRSTCKQKQRGEHSP